MMKSLRNWLAGVLAAAANKVRTDDGPGPFVPRQ